MVLAGGGGWDFGEGGKTTMTATDLDNKTGLSLSLSLFQDGQSRTVRQFQFTDWPEQGVPKSGEGFIDFIGQVHKTKEQFGQDGPISVHCRWAAPRAAARGPARETEAS